MPNPKRTLVIVLLATLVLLAGAAYRSFVAGGPVSVDQNGEPGGQQYPASQPSATSTAEVPPDVPPATSTLKTYRNEEWGFEFGYPDDWTLHPILDPLRGPFSKFQLIGTTPEEKVPNTIVPTFLVNIVTPDFVERQFGDLKNSATRTSVGGVEGEKYDYADQVTEVAVILQLKQYKMILNVPKKHEDVFNQILATFKFLQ